MNWFREFWKRLTTPLRQQPPFTPRAAQILVLARQEAKRLRHNFIGTEHILLGLIRLGQGVAVNVLTALGVDLESLRSEIEARVPAGTRDEASGPIDFTPKVKNVLALADEERKALKHTHLGTEHILLGLLRQGDGFGGVTLKDLGVNLETTRGQIRKELEPCFKDETGTPR